MDTVNYQNLDKLDSFKDLLTEYGQRGVPSLRSLLTVDRISSCSLPVGGGVTYNYSSRQVDGKYLTLLYRLAREARVLEKYRLLLNGEKINTGEDRMVLHHYTRGLQGVAPPERENELGGLYRSERTRIRRFVEGVHRGDITGSTGKSFTTVVQIGIGGSDLGPRALYIALKGWAQSHDRELMKGEFISNVDPDDAAEVLSRVDCERTLFVLVSKSGTTQETLANMELVVNWCAALGVPGLDASRQMVAVTAKGSPLTKAGSFLDCFYIDDYVGGRYSSTSGVGGVLLSLAFGWESFQELLDGAVEADRNALLPAEENAALTDALIGVFERNILGYPATAILPYSQALNRFPAHLQQLDMESNGKRVNRFGERVEYSTGPIVFGEPGTNGQHSFYQLLHQGTDPVPLQFIGFAQPQRGTTEGGETPVSTGQRMLIANLVAQIVAFAQGKEDSEGRKDFPGERPSSLLHGERLIPRSLGSILAHFENKVMFQGFLWNINSFDQEGVQLGKRLADQLLQGEGSTQLREFSRIIGGF